MSLQTNNYLNILSSLKEKIRQARLKAVLTANAQLLSVYWEIGNTIAEQEKKEGWGAKTVDKLSSDLKSEFEDMKGLSPRNLRYMRDFAMAYPNLSILQHSVAKLPEQLDDSILQQAVAKLPWGHHITILTKTKVEEERFFYIQSCIENNWSRDVLALQIENNLYKRQGKSINNFSNTLLPVDSDLANATFKNPYLFDFLSMGEKMKERDLENSLINHLKKFMLELGKGFAYVGNQYNLNVEGDDYFLDLLFYNTHMHCYVVFELKLGEFKPEFAGKLNFYINTIDAQIKGTNDKPTIGVLLCKTPNDTVIKFALQGIKTPIGVAEYQLADALPKQLKGEMPTIEELEKEIEESYEELKTPTQKRFDTLKEKLAAIKGKEIQQTATTQILFDIFDISLIPLFQGLLFKMEDFKEMFFSTSYYWQGKDEVIEKIEDLSKTWKDEEFLKTHYDLSLTYKFNGFKKAGTETFDVWFEFKYRIDTYRYEFSLVNYNNHQSFKRKLYHEQLNMEEIDEIISIVYNWVMDQIESRIVHLNK